MLDSLFQEVTRRKVKMKKTSCWAWTRPAMKTWGLCYRWSAESPSCGNLCVLPASCSVSPLLVRLRRPGGQTLGAGESQQHAGPQQTPAVRHRQSVSSTSLSHVCLEPLLRATGVPHVQTKELFFFSPLTVSLRNLSEGTAPVDPPQVESERPP